MRYYTTLRVFNKLNFVFINSYYVFKARNNNIMLIVFSASNLQSSDQNVLLLSVVDLLERGSHRNWTFLKCKNNML